MKIRVDVFRVFNFVSLKLKIIVRNIKQMFCEVIIVIHYSESMSTSAMDEAESYQKIPKKELFINLSKASPKSSTAWNYFGFLWVKEPSRKIVQSAQKRIFCKICFDALGETDLLSE